MKTLLLAAIVIVMCFAAISHDTFYLIVSSSVYLVWLIRTCARLTRNAIRKDE